MANEKDKDRNTAPDREDVKEPTIIQCNIHNPLRGRRVIHDGITDAYGRQKAIVVDGGDTVYNVTLAKTVAEELRNRNRVARDSDLVIGPPTEAPPKPAPAAQPEPVAS